MIMIFIVCCCCVCVCVCVWGGVLSIFMQCSIFYLLFIWLWGAGIPKSHQALCHLCISSFSVFHTIETATHVCVYTTLCHANLALLFALFKGSGQPRPWTPVLGFLPVTNVCKKYFKYYIKTYTHKKQ